jgi:hypothetical protein
MNRSYRRPRPVDQSALHESIADHIRRSNKASPELAAALPPGWTGNIAARDRERADTAPAGRVDDPG